MKAKGLDIDISDPEPRFVEKTLNETIPETDSANPPTDPEISENIKATENDQKNNEDVPHPKREEVILDETPSSEDQPELVKTALIEEELPAKENLEKATPRNWKQDLTDWSRTNFEFFFEYFVGFVVGVSMSLLGYRFVKFINKKRRTRKGLFVGCMVSFVLIFFLCIFYMTYTRNVLLTKRSWTKHHHSMKKLKIPGFSLYLKYSVSSITHGLTSAMRSLLPSFSYSSRRHRRSRQKTKHKIRALRHMRSRIHRHLRVLL